jgi:hypothetical protein
MPLQEAPLARWLAAKPDDEVTGRIRMALTKRDDLRGDRAPGESPSIGTLGMVSRRVRLHVLGHRTLVVGDAYLTSICPERPHGMLALRDQAWLAASDCCEGSSVPEAVA